MKASRSDINSLSRLDQQAAFDRLRKSATRWVSEGLVLQALPQETQKDKIGVLISVSKKIAPRSVDRSRIRRRLRAISAEILPGGAVKGYDYAVIARTATLNRPYETLQNDLRWCLKRLNLPPVQPS